MIYNICPVSKPRMTQRDKWEKRPATTKYWNFKDDIKNLGIKINLGGSHIIFHMPMPKSWGRSKRLKMIGRPHQVKPDIDNLMKALMDALYKNDSSVWDCRITKVWANDGKIEVKSLEGI